MTTMSDPRAKRIELGNKWKTAQQPKPLAAYDLPLQWIMLAGCMGISAYMVFLVLLPAARTVYTWEPTTRRLTLPSGRSITPSDLAEVDKRRWDKFYVVLNLKDSAPGGPVPLDLLRHKHLEDWVLEMEKEAFPGSATDDSPPDGGPDGAGNAESQMPNNATSA
jgi:hypothetical protein